MMTCSTLCYMERDGKYLMLHRTVKKNDVNKDKWIGVGGHFEQGESPEDCVLREVKEETGYTLTSFRYRGLVTFVQGDSVTEYMSLFTADGFEGEPAACDEGELAWVSIEDVWNLNIWEGDKIFFRLLDEDIPFFSLKLMYSAENCFLGAVLNGKPLELFDILNEDGTKSGLVRERGVVHRQGSLHAAAHVWVARPGKDGGFDLLLQKRSSQKDSYPGCFDISAAGHVATGDDVFSSAVRELKEELGIEAVPEELAFVGRCRRRVESVFYGRPFLDYEESSIYVYRKPVDAGKLTLQESEVEAVLWMDDTVCLQGVLQESFLNCIYEGELRMVMEFVRRESSDC